jgi:hypothetical protein
MDVDVAVRVGVFVSAFVGVDVNIGVDADVGVRVGVFVDVGVGVDVDVGVDVGTGVQVEEKVEVEVELEVEVGVDVAVGTGVQVEVEVDVGVVVLVAGTHGIGAPGVGVCAGTGVPERLPALNRTSSTDGPSKTSLFQLLLSEWK